MQEIVGTLSSKVLLALLVVALQTNWTSCMLPHCRFDSSMGWGSDFHPPVYEYDHVMSHDAILKNLMSSFAKFGLVLVEGVPRIDDTNATHSFAKRLLPDGEEIQSGTFWSNAKGQSQSCIGEFHTGIKRGADKEAKSASGYGPSRVPLHTEGAYMQEPLRAKLLHVVRYDGAVSGFPTNMFVDSQHILSHLDSEEQSALKASIGATFDHSIEDETTSSAPLFSCMRAWPDLQGAGISKEGQLRVAWNAGSLSHGSKKVSWNTSLQSAAYQRALRKFDNLADTNTSSTHLFVPLVPGRLVMLDNWRVLHGRGDIADNFYRRMVFADLSEKSLVKRWMELTRTSNVSRPDDHEESSLDDCPSKRCIEYSQKA